MRPFAALLSVAPALLVAVTATPRALADGPNDRIVEGEVVRSSSRWTPDGGTIMTESVIRADDGREVTVRQVGGTVDGVSMVVWHGPPALTRGDYIAVELVDSEPVAGGYSIRRLTEPVHRLAFVQARNDFQAPLAWISGCVFITIDAAGTTHVPGDQERQVIEDALGEWQFAADSCSYLEFRLTEPASASVGLDGKNVIQFRENTWCRNGDTSTCYDPSTAGLTTMSFINNPDSDRDGELLDADIELNAVHFSISVDGVTSGRPSCKSDLANTATHEIGHLLGLDHTCWDGTFQPRPVDENGAPVPSCFPAGSLTTEIVDATMYNFQDCDERKKASLEPDDIDAICGIYPAAADPQECSPASVPRGGCCVGSVSGRTDPLEAVAGVLGLLLLARVSSRRRPAPRGKNTARG